MAVRRSSVFELGIPVIGSPHQRIIEYINAVAHAQQEHNNDDTPSALNDRKEYSLAPILLKLHEKLRIRNTAGFPGYLAKATYCF
jgi:hypothetical protein